MKNLRRLLLLALVILVAGAIVWAYVPRPVRVSITVVSKGPMDVSIEEEGRTRVQDRYLITAPVAAYAPRLEFRVGDLVRAGQTLAVLEPLPPGALDARSRAEAQARVAQAKAALLAAETGADAARAGADYAERELSRAQTLKKSGAVSQTMLDQAESQARQTTALLASARARIDVARYDLAAAETSLRYTTTQSHGAGGERIPVKSPVDGVILAIEHEDEGVVGAAQPIVTVGDRHSLEVAVDLLSSDAVRVGPATQVIFTRWGGPRPLEGRVRNVEPVAFTKVSALGVEEQRVLVIVDIVSPKDEWAALGDAYRLEARFIVWQADSVLRVPSSAIYRRGDSWAVLAVADGRLVERRLKIGERGDDFAQVLDGLAPGEAVVTFPDDSLHAGDRATVVESVPM
ncbi:MAG TPA: efflux RND transporter periplasmic adaptor subunit [Gammaproteobacteria bacterium]|nr:efflux RND transporter periplasmic adaptor subunit [Gammaproteobacteria bacterium]